VRSAIRSDRADSPRFHPSNPCKNQSGSVLLKVVSFTFVVRTKLKVVRFTFVGRTNLKVVRLTSTGRRRRYLSAIQAWGGDGLRWCSARGTGWGEGTKWRRWCSARGTGWRRWCSARGTGWRRWCSARGTGWVRNEVEVVLCARKACGVERARVPPCQRFFQRESAALPATESGHG
jgi:hypothetical protein